ncbi:hypothetical protein [Polluticoccus soli]|uniref:hypothetical protein n=1 Tax=Polluticoccus soli TaxID=3034150 RepID=UPI0023E25158|nr:hypothetical protein [Flavipsychrobacter sp. JY13-12]
MKNFIYAIVCLSMMLTFPERTAYAAFPIKAGEEISAKTERRSFDELVNTAIERFHLPLKPTRDITETKGKVLNIVSFALGFTGAGAITVAAFAPAAALTLLALATGMGIAAIITGVKGSESDAPLKGLGIAGYVLGIIDLTALLIVLIATVVLLALILFGN